MTAFNPDHTWHLVEVTELGELNRKSRKGDGRESL